MNSETVKKILNYIDFYKAHFNYPIYIKDIPKKNSISLQKENDIFSEKESEQTWKTDRQFSYSGIINSGENKTEAGISVSESLKEIAMPLIKENWMDSGNFSDFAESIKDCQKCKLLARTRKRVVFGTGNPQAEVVVVGEAPGADEDEQGKPFVGRAGKLLTDILSAINFSRDEVFICNILKCRPPENRNPLPDEISNCEPYLFKQLEMIKPKLILAVGTFAAQTLLKTKEPLGKLRGKFHNYKGIKMMVTYHPAALLRNPNWKKPTWEDVKLFRKEYDRLKKN